MRAFYFAEPTFFYKHYLLRMLFSNNLVTPKRNSNKILLTPAHSTGNISLTAKAMSMSIEPFVAHYVKYTPLKLY